MRYCSSITDITTQVQNLRTPYDTQVTLDDGRSLKGNLIYERDNHFLVVDELNHQTRVLNSVTLREAIEQAKESIQFFD